MAACGRSWPYSAGAASVFQRCFRLLRRSRLPASIQWDLVVSFRNIIVVTHSLDNEELTTVAGDARYAMRLARRDSSHVTRCQYPLLVGESGFNLQRAFDTENSVGYFTVVVPRHTLAWPHGQNRYPEILDLGNNLATFDFVAPAHEPSTLMYFLNMMRLRVEFSSPHITSIEHRKNPTNFVCC